MKQSKISEPSLIRPANSNGQTISKENFCAQLARTSKKDVRFRNHLTQDIKKPNVKTTICDLIVENAKKKPERTAVIDGKIKITYDQLLKRIEEVAGELEIRGMKPGSLVGICMNRSWEMIAALIGVMQAGCAYVPLDPDYPQERIAYMLSHSGALAAIVDSNEAATVCQAVKEVIWISKLTGHKTEFREVSQNDLAYVIYTSGSTGKPKGVAVEHRSVVCLSEVMRGLFTDDEMSGVFAGASICFDTSVMEIMGTLSLGGTVILAKNALDLLKLPAVDQVRTCVMVASSMQALLATGTLPKGIKCLVFGGEALKYSLVQQVYLLRPDLRVLNAYGPTEDTVFSTISEVSRDAKVVTIGKSVAHSRSYILDHDMRPVLNGVPGELYLAGYKLARGYLHNEVQTRKRFIEVTPTDDLPDSRLYRTGDLCSWTENGEIEFLGRVDQQVKVRGFRIELEEIESTLESMVGVDAAAATVIEGSTGQKIIVIYVVSRDETVSEKRIKSYLSDRLPKYMIPQVVRYLKELPLLPNDKLDRKKLTNMGSEKVTEHKKTQISFNSEDNKQAKESLASQLIFNDEKKIDLLFTIKRELKALLNLGEAFDISSDDSFNSLGLDSLTTLEFSSRLSKVLGLEIAPASIMENSTPHSLSSFLLNVNDSVGNPVDHAKNCMVPIETLSTFQLNLQSSHPTFQAASAPSWSVNDKSKLVSAAMLLVNRDRINPYGKVLQTGSASKGIVSDIYNNEEQDAIIWSTNLYFGLNRDAEVIKESTRALELYGTGMGISAAATGMTDQHLEFEKEFADLVGKSSACLFPTGYTANLGAISGLLSKNDVVVIDQLCHASIVDGTRLSGAKVRTFKHNSAEDLAEVLKSEASPYRTVLVVLESVYSMGEGTAPVAEIVRTAKKYNALTLVDEAHSFGFYGECGAGVCADQGVTEEVDFIMTTLSKALGSIGGVIAASQEHIELLKSSSRAYIFQASISPADIAAGLSSLRRLRSDNSLREQLWDVTRYMRRRFEEEGYNLGTGDGPIVTPHFGEKQKLYSIVQKLYKRGVQTLAVTYPIVEMGQGRLRFICSASHTYEDVEKTLKALFEAEREAEEEMASSRNAPQEQMVDFIEIDRWAKNFVSYLKESFGTSNSTIPDLLIAVRSIDQENTTAILIKEGDVILNAPVVENLFTCSLVLKNRRAVSALQSFDVVSLLRNICEGNCILNGQVEAFIWLVGRMVDKENTVHTEVNLELS